MNTEAPADLDTVRASYDAVADNYVAMVGDPGPWLRSALDAFAEQVREIGPVLDAGCGPGWIWTTSTDEVSPCPEWTSRHA